MNPRDVSVAIPTFQRESVLIDTLEALATSGAGEILVVDQTPTHESRTETRLREMDDGRLIRWLRLPEPSIPHAMNVALGEAVQPLVLFLDDDIEPAADLVAAHAASYDDDPGIWAVVGQVLQPGETPTPVSRPFRTSGLKAFLDFPFNSTEPTWVENVMAGNLSVRRDRALAVGGFDENFVGVAYRFETEFCRRLCRREGRVLFQPRASIRHLRAARGGTRSHGHHLTSASPAHGVGDYYFTLRQGLGLEAIAYILARPLRKVWARFYLRRPWWIPVGLLGELRAFLLALRLVRRGPRYVTFPVTH
jgi:GT2 family glycosyltransferase